MHEDDDPWRHQQPPDNEIPASVALDAVLASNEDIVVFVAGMDVFRNGIGFTVEVRVRPGTRAGDGGSRLLHDIHDHGSERRSLLLGIEFADGRRCSTAGTRRPARGSTSEDAPQLCPGGEPIHEAAGRARELWPWQPAAPAPAPPAPELPAEGCFAEHACSD